MRDRGGHRATIRDGYGQIRLRVFDTTAEARRPSRAPSNRRVAPSSFDRFHARLKADQLLLALRRRAHQHQHAFGLRLHVRLQIDAVRPDVDVMARRQIALLPSPIFVLPLALEAPDHRQRVVRHGHDPVRAIQTGIGPVEVQKPKARDRGATAGARIRFTSNILPKWARRTKSLDALLPVLYLRGISAGDFQEALAALLGKDAPNLSAAQVAIGDGALGFWKALDEAFPTTRHQRCWLHKALNVLNKFPKSMQPNAHKDLREIWLSPDRASAEAAMATFAEKYTPKYDKAVECLIKDRQTLLTFFDLPADHWDHLRTSNPIESVFATVRHRTVRMKGALSQDTARLMVFKLVMAASRTWRRLKGQNQLPKVVNGIKFKTESKLSPKSNPPLDSRRHRLSRVAPAQETCGCPQSRAVKVD